MGRGLVFCDVIRNESRSQVMLSAREMPDFSFSDLRIGTFVDVQGEPFRTDAGEETLRAQSISITGRVYAQVPWGATKMHTGGARHLDMLLHPESSRLFRLRSQFVFWLRHFLQVQNSFLEVETPILSRQAGGASAKPFRIADSNRSLWLRIAPELHLKQLLVGGWERVFEIGRVFRDEDADPTHAPEFTTLEAYQAFTTLPEMLRFSMKMFRDSAAAFSPTKVGLFGDQVTTVDVSDQLALLLDAPYDQWNKQLIGRFLTANPDIQIATPWSVARAISKVIESRVERRHREGSVLFVGHPLCTSPLASAQQQSPWKADRFEFFIDGMEIANSYSEQNDGIKQRLAFSEDESPQLAPEEEAFCSALDCGMPPAVGLGVGVDRLLMALTERRSIRDVILFP